MEQPAPVTVILRKKEYRARPGQTVAQAIRQIGLNPAAYLVTRSGEMITEDEPLAPGEVITLIAVVSGG
jgi:sulfur carrier protein ThiS